MAPPPTDPTLADLAVTELAPAKLNLALHVTGRRADGFHLLESLVVFTRFGDRLHVEPAAEDGFAIDGPFADQLDAGAGNLVLRAREALRQALPEPARQVLSPAAVRLEKNLPVASGIGGGSSDAAAALRSLNRLWGSKLDDRALAEIGAGLGADVPMCLAARPLVAKGIGEIVEPVADFPTLALVLVNPGAAVATPEVFARLTRRDGESLPPLPGTIDFHSLRNWLETTRNDLEPAAREIQPAIGQALAALNKAGSGFSRMSGSGATCFGLFETGNVAKRAALAIRAKHPGWFVAATRGMPSPGRSEEA
ncbi:4-(cytidine 5'-diphospho)-2-C-methyl-D-erythritol kinase [Mesorhizobium sp. 8]|uniref:4-(cytidine 5'-diphospho)-2-C-methyl-D-erythritol kinase n=1 Tax=Mesorhizobium sp. 8 TaxID=2584466 RepID=UPI001FF044D4|nr:4-(cytidine 5'-diphospho)-2-C-methyl-D-erythritol kinase [Mesorhizobium sp. 8]